MKKSTILSILAIILIMLFSGYQQKKRIFNESEIDKIFLLGKFDPSKDDRFSIVDSKYIGNPKKIYLLDEVYQAYRQMYDSALSDSIKLNIISGFRSYWHQKYLWETKWEGKRKIVIPEGQTLPTNDYEKAQLILNYSAMPGTSRHHWGTDIDLLSIDDEDFKKEKYKKAYEWLKQNASKYGFCQTYTTIDSTRRTGFSEEKWHWSFFPISEKVLKRYRLIIKNSDISGFKGAEVVDTLKVIENYVFSISQECQ